MYQSIVLATHETRVQEDLEVRQSSYSLVVNGIRVLGDLCSLRIVFLGLDFGVQTHGICQSRGKPLLLVAEVLLVQALVDLGSPFRSSVLI